VQRPGVLGRVVADVEGNREAQGDALVGCASVRCAEILRRVSRRGRRRKTRKD
jgi:hypothetical protein